MSLSNTRPEISGSSLRAAISSRAVFFTTSALAYTTAIIAATLTLNPYFSQTWDVNTFIHAARALLDSGSPFDLYAQSRAAQTWPYAYPPLHAFVVAIALCLGDLARGLPEYVWARAPVIGADIGVALVLYRSVLQKASDETIARAAALVWLFNPITFYDTAVQGHFESAWLGFILLAYAWVDDARPIALPAIALAFAVLFKQIAIVFAIPVFVSWIVRWLNGWIVCAPCDSAPLTDKRANRQTIQLTNLLFAFALFGLVIGAVCLPFLLYSEDFVFMNLTYVENIPVQTSSWIVALVGFTRTAPNALTSDFVLLRYQTIVTILAAIALGFVGARRGWNLYLTATLIALAFFLTSKKVMGYYYVMLLPFLLAQVLSRRRFDLALVTLVATSYIALSPYYAAWTNHAHWWVYAILGTVNSLFFVWLFVQLTADRRPPHPSTALYSAQDAVGSLRLAVAVSFGLFAVALFAALLQPLSPDNGSPIRAPIIASGTEMRALLEFAALVILSAIALAIIARATRRVAGALPRAAFGVVLIFAPLFFSVYTLTKESTAIFEIALKMLGV